MTRKKSAETIDLEIALQQLQELVERMEKGQLPLEDSLKSFEEGIQLVRQCQEVLQKAEQNNHKRPSEQRPGFPYKAWPNPSGGVKRIRSSKPRW